ncbi:MAG TPA: single-stranded-DNA-specific exonuclease RecJ [Bacteroidetes bacterium]|nr:single-stranded-DNA-specific exonuclease RecJ [Bacteroidota bacterium]
MKKRWVVKGFDQGIAKHLNDVLKIHPVLCQLLAQRSIATFSEAKDFFRPEWKHLHDPFLMKDMDKAIARIQSAMQQKEKILIYGDYDVDGTTSVATVYTFLKKYYNDLNYYLPDRYIEGYGISHQGIDWAKANGFQLIIALDCGIKAMDKIEYANNLGIDFIICDHHLPGEEIPAAVAVLDPKRVDCDYPYKELSGCGIGFKLMQAFALTHSIPEAELHSLLDLVVISIASDIVPITGENRVLAFLGLQQLNNNPREGVKALIKASNAKRELNISDIVFILGPRINAAGRMDDARNAVKLLISETSTQAENNADTLNEKNKARKEVDESITNEALQMLNDDSEQEKKSTVLFQPHWHKGVIGIVASRMLDHYYRPTIILTESNGVAAGSARSVAGYDIYNAIKSCSDLLEQFGGHMFAAGLTLKKENVEAFKQRFEEVVSQSIDERMLVPEITIDAEISPADISNRFYDVLKQFAPFGPHNMKPVFVSKRMVDTGHSRIVGVNHLKLSLMKTDTPYRLNGIAFSGDQYFDLVKSKVPIDICYTLEENEWNNIKTIEMNVRDIIASEPI